MYHGTPRAWVATTRETRARIARYRWLRQKRRELGARWIVTAHHADDQRETILMRMLRGSGPAGLAGMQARSRDILRPLLPFSRATITGYAERQRPDVVGGSVESPAVSPARPGFDLSCFRTSKPDSPTSPRNSSRLAVMRRAIVRPGTPLSRDGRVSISTSPREGLPSVCRPSEHCPRHSPVR